jgi:multicomponent Na+:H+ antiporter subunit C
VIWSIAVAVAALIAAGVYLALGRELLRAVVGLSLIGAGANLAVLAAGRVGSAVPAVVPPGDEVLAAAAANPLPQALVLTAIVISFSLVCFSLLLTLALAQQSGVADSRDLNAAEPRPRADGQPAVLDEQS